MAFLTISADLDGNIFSIDQDGDLFRNRHAALDGATRFDRPYLGDRIGSGWSGVQHLVATRAVDRTVLAGMTYDGKLRTAQRPGITARNWTDVSPDQPSADKDNPDYAALRQLFPGPNGTMYGIGIDGALYRQRFRAGAGQLTVEPLVPVLSGAGDKISNDDWRGFAIGFTTGEGLFFGVTCDGALMFQRNTAKDADGSSFAGDGWKLLQHGWFRFQAVMAAGAQAIYAITTEGDVEVHRFSKDTNGVPVFDQSKHVAANNHCRWSWVPAAIEGYCHPRSVFPGETVRFMIGRRQKPEGVPPRPFYVAQYRRLNRPRDVDRDHQLETLPEARADEQKAPTTGQAWLRDANGIGWTETCSKQIPVGDPDWTSGIYALRCTDRAGESFYVPFIVKPRPGSRRKIAVLANTNTWNAYNNWGGFGKYTGPKDDSQDWPGFAPFLRSDPGLIADQLPLGSDKCGQDIGSQNRHKLRAELWVLGWLDECVAAFGPDYRYDVYTDQDLHDGIEGIDRRPTSGSRYKALILNTHPEYWTTAMYDRTLTYLNAGGSLIYLGGNGVYEEVRYDAGRTIMEIFPGVTRTPGDDNAGMRNACLLRNRGRPEARLLGVEFADRAHPDVPGQALQLVQDSAGQPLLKGVLVPRGGQIGKSGVNYLASGWEVDRIGPAAPAAAHELSALIATGVNEAKGGHMLFFETGKRGHVFAAGSLNFGGSLALDADLQTIVRNALCICLTGSPCR